MTTTANKQIKILVNNTVLLSNKWGVFKAAQNLPRIGKTFAVPVSFIFSAMEETNLREAIPQAIFMLFEQLEEQDIKELLEIILDDVYANNGQRKVDIEADFLDLDDLITTCAKVLEQQYGGLLKGKGLKALFQQMVPLTQAAE